MIKENEEIKEIEVKKVSPKKSKRKRQNNLWGACKWIR